MEETVREWCPYCEGEVDLPIEFGKYKCPGCGEIIANCCVCYTDQTDCNKCPLGVN